MKRALTMLCVVIMAVAMVAPAAATSSEPQTCEGLGYTYSILLDEEGGYQQDEAVPYAPIDEDVKWNEVGSYGLSVQWDAGVTPGAVIITAYDGAQEVEHPTESTGMIDVESETRHVEYCYLDLGVTIDVASSTTVGETFDLTVTPNTGGVAVEEFSTTITLPTGYVVASTATSSDGWSCATPSGDELECFWLGASTADIPQLVINGTIADTAGDSLTFTACTTDEITDDNEIPDCDSDDTVLGMVDLGLTINVPATVKSGTEINVEIDVTNGSVPADDVVVTVPVPDDFAPGTLPADTDGWTCVAADATTLSCVYAPGAEGGEELPTLTIPGVTTGTNATLISFTACVADEIEGDDTEGVLPDCDNDTTQINNGSTLPPCTDCGNPTDPPIYWSDQITDLIDPSEINIVLLGRDDVFADSLSSGGLQGMLNAPLLLSNKDSLSADTAEELQRLDPELVIFLGGTVALSETVWSDVQALGFETDRVWDTERVGTSVDAARRYAPDAEVALMARAYPADGGRQSQAFADSLAAGAFAAHEDIPVLLSNHDALNPKVREYLMGEGSEIRAIHLIGGEAALSTAVVEELESLGITVKRYEGANRVATAVRIASEGLRANSGNDVESVLLVNAEAENAWVDAFPAALWSAESSVPILLTNPEGLSPETEEWLGDSTPVVLCGLSLRDTKVCADAQRRNQ